MYPVILKLKGIKCLIVGGGKVGERKAKWLIGEKALVHLISRKVSPWFEDMIKNNKIVWLSEEYNESFLEGISIVFAATDDRELNSLITRDALRRGLWCNSITNPDEGNLVLPAVFRRGKLTISVSTDGASPYLARLIRDSMADVFDADWDRSLYYLDNLRKAIQTIIPGYNEERLELFRQLARIAFEDLRENKEFEVVKKNIEKLLSLRFSEEELSRLRQELAQC